MLPDKPSKHARIAAVLTLMGSLVWVQWPVDFERFNAAAVILAIGSFVTWAGIEFADKQTTPTPNEVLKQNDNILIEDVDKMNSIIKIIDKNQYYTLKHTAIQTYMDRHAYSGLRELNHFKTNDIFPFHIATIQQAYLAFADSSEHFLGEFYNLYTSDGHGSSTWRPRGDGYVEDEVFEKIMGKIAKLDRQASGLATEWEEFIALARLELKGASKSIDRYES